jgi:thiol-disulfide isomerase/thioredoxin
MAEQPNSTHPSFWTPMRIVSICVIVGVAVAIWLSMRNTGTQTNQTGAGVASSNPPNRSANPPATAPPNTVATNAAPPAVTAVPLSEDIRQTKVKTIDGGSLKLADFKNKVLVVNIWATWCGPCRMEMPDLVKLNHEYKSRGLVVLGVATTYNESDDQERVKNFIKTQKIDYKILWDDGSLAQPLVQSMNGRNVIPQSFVISRDGKIVKYFPGFNAMSTPTLMRQAVEEALADKGKV